MMCCACNAAKCLAWVGGVVVLGFRMAPVALALAGGAKQRTKTNARATCAVVGRADGLGLPCRKAVA